jgi:hypothetical protein
MTLKQYKDTYNKKFNELPKWKQLAIKEDSTNNKQSGILTDFVKDVIETAEKEFSESEKPKSSSQNLVSQLVEKKINSKYNTKKNS